MSRFDPLIKWLERNGLLKSVTVDAAAAPPTAASKNLLGASAHGMSELVADEVLGAGGYAAPAVAAAAPASPATQQRAANAALNTLETAEAGVGRFTQHASIRAAHRPADAPKPGSYEEHLNGDGGRVPEEAKGQGR